MTIVFLNLYSIFGLTLFFFLLSLFVQHPS